MKNMLKPATAISVLAFAVFHVTFATPGPHYGIPAQPGRVKREEEKENTLQRYIGKGNRNNCRHENSCTLGESCIFDNDCHGQPQLTCHDTFCVFCTSVGKCAVGQGCTTDNDCMQGISLRCLSNKCVTCEAISMCNLGEACSKDSDCGGALGLICSSKTCTGCATENVCNAGDACSVSSECGGAQGLVCTSNVCLDCATSNLCNVGDPCSNDIECVEGMICGKLNCPWDSSKDCCRPKCTDGSGTCCGNNGQAGGKCLLDEGNCSSDEDCWNKSANFCTDGACSFAGSGVKCCRAKCDPMHQDCCSELAALGGRCRRGEGLCTSDSECESGYVCKQGCCPGDEFGTTKCCRINCKLSANEIECCRSSSRAANSLVTFPCDVGEGDCDVSDDCIGSLNCGANNCPWDATGIEDCCQ